MPLFVSRVLYPKELSKDLVAPYVVCVCESFVRSRGGCLHTYLGFPRFKIMSRTW